MQPDAKFKNVSECTTTCGLRYMYLQYVEKKSVRQYLTEPDKTKGTNWRRRTELYRIICFSCSLKVAKNPEATVMKSRIAAYGM